LPAARRSEAHRDGPRWPHHGLGPEQQRVSTARGTEGNKENNMECLLLRWPQVFLDLEGSVKNGNREPCVRSTRKEASENARKRSRRPPRRPLRAGTSRPCTGARGSTGCAGSTGRSSGGTLLHALRGPQARPPDGPAGLARPGAARRSLADLARWGAALGGRRATLSDAPAGPELARLGPAGPAQRFAERSEADEHIVHFLADLDLARLGPTIGTSAEVGGGAAFRDTGALLVRFLTDLGLAFL
jgi:hypothetical protein